MSLHRALPLLLAFAACTADVSGGHGPDTGEPGPDDLPGDPFEAAPIPERLEDGAIAALTARLDGVLAQSSVAGTRQSVIVVDAENGQVLFEKGADTLLIGASNTKLFTTGAALEVLGPDHALRTTVHATADLDAGGVLAGDLIVTSNHDFTASTYFYANPRLPLDRLAGALYERGLRRVDGALILSGEMLYAGDNFGSYDASSARASAVLQLDAALAARQITTGATATSPDLTPPMGAALLLEDQSAPLSVACVPLNVSSHNEFADILLRHVGSELGGVSSYAAGEAAVLDWLRSLGVSVEGLAFKDGSGLSRENRMSARVIAAMLGGLISSSAGSSALRTLSIAGVRGTLGSRLTGADTRGRFFGKTGTLSGVIATSGVLFHRHDNRRVIISMLMNDVGSSASARAVQDQVISAVGEDWRSGAALETPTLLSVRNHASNLVDIGWTAVAGADGYIVWVSPDGQTWSRDDARFIRGRESVTHRADGLHGEVHVRVTAWSSADGESAPSDSYPTTASRYPSAVLLVDGNDRYQRGPAIENPAGLAHDLGSRYAGGLGPVGMDTVANEVIEARDVDLAGYHAVVWMLGEESTEDEALSGVEQTALMGYLVGGGQLLISGAELGWDLVAQGDESDRSFYREILKSDYMADDADSYAAASTLASSLDPAARIDFYNPGLLDVAYADVLAPVGGARSWLDYEGGGAAAVFYDGAYRVINVGFPIETIDNDPDRRAVLEAAMVAFELD